MESAIPLSEFASKLLEEHVKQRYLQKFLSIGVDPALFIEGEHFEPVKPIVYHQ